jgi:hypothetical protein
MVSLFEIGKRVLENRARVARTPRGIQERRNAIRKMNAHKKYVRNVANTFISKYIGNSTNGRNLKKKVNNQITQTYKKANDHINKAYRLGFF